MRLVALLALLLPALASAQQVPLQVTWPDQVTAGDPIGISILSWLDGPVTASLNGEPLDLVSFGGGLAAFSLAPLGSETASWQLHVQAEDGTGSVHDFFATVQVTADPRPVEELSIPASVLSLSTDAARDTEARMRERVMAAPLADPQWTEAFILPVEGARPTSVYGDPRRYAPGGRVSFHEGSDMAVPQGTPVLATNSGLVLVAAEFPTYPIKGGLVVIDHGAGVMSWYLHLSRVHVQEGQTIGRGELIGEVGSTGLSTGPHLHWEVRIHDRATNPLAWTGKTVPH